MSGAGAIASAGGHSPCAGSVIIPSFGIPDFLTIAITCTTNPYGTPASACRYSSPSRLSRALPASAP